MMTDDHDNDAVQRLLRLIADRLEAFLDGDDLAFETLGETLEQAGYAADEIHAAVLVLHSLAGQVGGAAHASVEAAPGKRAHRVWSDEERESLSPEAWGLLLDLRRRGSLDPEQFERVLDVLTTSAPRPIGIEAVREVAARIALRVDESVEVMETGHGDVELAH